MEKDEISQKIMLLCEFNEEIKTFEKTTKKRTQLPRGVDKYYLTASVGHVINLVSEHAKAQIAGDKLRFARAYRVFDSKTGHLWSEADSIKLRKAAEDCKVRPEVIIEAYSQEIQRLDYRKKVAEDILEDLMDILPFADFYYAYLDDTAKSVFESQNRTDVDMLYYKYRF